MSFLFQMFSQFFHCLKLQLKFIHFYGATHFIHFYFLSIRRFFGRPIFRTTATSINRLSFRCFSISLCRACVCAFVSEPSECECWRIVKEKQQPKSIESRRGTKKRILLNFQRFVGHVHSRSLVGRVLFFSSLLFSLTFLHEQEEKKSSRIFFIGSNFSCSKSRTRKKGSRI